jgi:hypothetical protein
MNTARTAAVEALSIDKQKDVLDATATSAHGIWVDDALGFSTRRLGLIHHNYHKHPLMQLDRLEQLAKSLLPTRQCRFLPPGVTQSSPFNHTPQSPDGSGIEEIFRRIEEPGSWVALYNVETDPVYQRFLWDVLGGAMHLIDRKEIPFKASGFVFISAPPSVTPFHIDRENNFWLQIRGRKTINVWDRSDREVVAAQDVEDFIVWRRLDNVRLKEDLRARSFEFDTGPGDGVYFPSTTPHMTRTDSRWVRPGDGVSISIGINFYTNATRRSAHVHALNGVLRKLGLTPRPPGPFEWLDRLKYPLGRAVVGVRRLRGHTPPQGF